MASIMPPPSGFCQALILRKGGCGEKNPETRGLSPGSLAFFKITCPTCQFTLPFLERLAASDKLQFVAVSQDGVKGTANFLKEYGVKFLTLLDASGYPVSNDYGITHVPTVFVVEQDGKISASFDGFSKRDVAALGQRAGIEPFQPGDYVPEWKAG